MSHLDPWPKCILTSLHNIWPLTVILKFPIKVKHVLHCRWIVEDVFGGLKQWFPFLRIKRHHSVYLPIGQAKVDKYCTRYGAELQGDWPEIPQVCLVISLHHHTTSLSGHGGVCCGLWAVQSFPPQVPH